jgi:hypothetical protein
MQRLYIGSMHRYSGKTFFALGLALALKRRGLSLGYIKPIGKTPETVGDATVDADALFFKSVLALDEPIEVISPFVSTFDSLSRMLDGKLQDVRGTINKAIDAVTDKDIVLIAGTTDLFEGEALGIDACAVSREAGARVLIVEAWNNEETLDDLIASRAIFGESLVGIIVNKVRPEAVPFVKDRVVPYLTERGIAVMGVIPTDTVLGAVTVRSLVDILGGKVLCAPEGLDRLVENFSIGAMDVNNALRYFKITPRKAVITGAERADILLAALETSTTCIIVTGGLAPNDVIVGRARLLDVPIISVKDDTFHTIDKVEAVMGRIKIRDESKVARARELVEAHTDIDALLRAIGLG